MTHLWGERQEMDEILSETTEAQHPHSCTKCGDGWLHADEMCAGSLLATCPICEGK